VLEMMWHNIQLIVLFNVMVTVQVICRHVASTEGTAAIV
jgi:hypothetical protein